MPNVVAGKFVVEMNAEDHAAYLVYLRLPAPIRWTVRAVVYLSRSDQLLVRRTVAMLSRKPGAQGRLAPYPEPACDPCRGSGSWRHRLLKLVRREPAA